MTTIADYEGREYDVFAFQGAAASGETQLVQELIDTDGGKICTGVQWLAQVFLITLLQEQGSVPYTEDEGTTFMTQLRRGELRTEIDVQIAFSFAVGQILRQFSRDPAVALDEQLVSAELVDITISPGFLSLRAKLTTADPNRAIILPVGITI
jgi:hypothetical protein